MYTPCIVCNGMTDGIVCLSDLQLCIARNRFVYCGLVVHGRRTSAWR